MDKAIKILLGITIFLTSITIYALELKLSTVQKKHIVDFSNTSNVNSNSQLNSNVKANKYNLPSFKVDDHKTIGQIPFDLNNLDERKLQEVTNEIERRLKKQDLNIPLTYENLNPRDKVLAESVRNLSIMGLALFAVLWSLPEDFTKWDKDRKISDVLDNWRENVKAGPAVDEDDWAVNYIGHPISGAYEYLFLRNKGFSRLESFGFSIFVSTVMWEYGIESFAEIPSIQDLILTPLVGSLMGEQFLKWDEKLKANDYVLWSSRRFGRIIHHIINPVEGINNVLNKFTQLKFLHLNNAYFYMSSNPTSTLEEVSDKGLSDNNFGIRFIFEF